MVSLFLIILFSTIIILLVYFYHFFILNLGYSVNNQKIWSSSFECGFSGHCVNINNFSVSFFILLVFFVVFDLEISLLLNLPLQITLFKNFLYYILFIYLLCLGYIIEILKGFINWQK